MEGQDGSSSKVVFTVSNKWVKNLHSLIGTKYEKYIATVRCDMGNEQTYNDVPYATMKFAYIKTILKKHRRTCAD